MALRRCGREGCGALPVMQRSGMMLGGGETGTRGRATCPPLTYLQAAKAGVVSQRP